METRTCGDCHASKPTSNFRITGRRAAGGKYRDTLCRSCRKRRAASAGRCICGNSASPGKLQCDGCLKRQRVSARRRLVRDRQAAFTYYGSCCAYCGESIELFLTIDHMKDDGAAHRRSLRAGGAGGHEIYAWLRKNGYPPNFQTLCFNCNAAKHILGEKRLLSDLAAMEHG